MYKIVKLDKKEVKSMFWPKLIFVHLKLWTVLAKKMMSHVLNVVQDIIFLWVFIIILDKKFCCGTSDYKNGLNGID